MTRTAIPLIAALLWLCKGLEADTVALTGGDRITGTVQKLEKGKLFFKTRYSETPLQIDWAQVAGLETDSEVQLTLWSGKPQTGRLAAAGGGMSFLAAGSATPIEAPAVMALERAPQPEESETSPGWIRRAWDNSSLSVDFDQSYSGLTHYNQFSSNSELSYEGDRWDGTFVTHTEFYGATDSAPSSYQAYGRMLGQRYIRGDRFFLFPYGFLGRQTMPDGGKGQLRQYGGGAGWTFRRHRSGQVSLYTGVVRNIGTGYTILPEEGRAESRVNDWLFVSAISWDRTLRKKITTSLKLFYFKPMFESGHHAMATEASTKIPLFGPAYFTVRVYDTPELRQRQLFSVKNLQVSSGIGIEF